MNVVAPITVAWQGVVDSVNGGAKEFETFEELDKAIVRARKVNDAAESLQNSNYAGSDSKAHITIHPGAYEYGSSVDQNTELEDVYITILPGARVTDSLQTFAESTTTNVADLNSFARTAFFSEKKDKFIFDSPVEFKDNVIFKKNTFPVKSIEGGKGIEAGSSFGDVTIFHGDTSDISGNTNEDTFLNKIQFDEFGHVTSAEFDAIKTGVGVEDDNTQVLGLAEDINFASNLSVVDDQDGTATVKIPGTDDFEISELENLFPTGEPLSKASGTVGVEAKLGTSAADYSKNELFPNDTETEKGVITPSYDPGGKLNPQVESTDLHDAEIFAKASKGTLKLLLNGSNLVTMGLSSTESAITRTSNSGNSSLSVSKSNSLLFPNGDTFERATQRSGTWNVGTEDMNVGLNKVKIVHEISGSVFGETQELLYFLEDTSFQTAVKNASFSVSLTSGSMKQLSGVTYNTEATVEFSVDVDNIYRNVYSEGNAIDFPVTEGVELLPQSVPELGPTEDKESQLNFTEETGVGGSRFVLESPSAQFRIKDPVEGQITSSTVSNLELLFDSTESLSTDIKHVFETEKYRIPSDGLFDTVIQSGEYDSTKLINDSGESGYNDGLQVTDGKIVYPSVDYSSVQDGPTGNPDYSQNISGKRVYYGLFENQQSVSNFILKVRGVGSLVSSGSLSTGTQTVSIEIKAPSQTGWLDVSNFFSVGEFDDGDGAYWPTNAENPKKSVGSNSEIGLTIGDKDTVDSFNRLYYRITAPEGWQGEITKMEISWGVS